MGTGDTGATKQRAECQGFLPDVGDKQECVFLLAEKATGSRMYRVFHYGRTEGRCSRRMDAAGIKTGAMRKRLSGD